MVTVACIKVGDKYGPEYVNRLAAMVERNVTQPYRFLCLTDNPKGLEFRYTDVGTDLPGWWAKIVLFRPHPALAANRVVYLDLDTVIVGNIDFLLEYDGPFCILKDFWSDRFNSSVMSIAPGFGGHIWSDLVRDRDKVLSRLHGDQDWITLKAPGSDTWNPAMIGSYKAHQLTSGPVDFRLICFHGMPKPDWFKKGWVYDQWTMQGCERI